MNLDSNQILEFFKGTFLTDASSIRQKYFNAKAFAFDWDGVFNDGYKNEKGSSFFSEIDSMGTNLLRFNHYLVTKNMPVVAIISGEKNDAALSFASREHFDAVYYKMADKTQALEHLCSKYSLYASEIVWVFDDVNDLAVARKAGLRLMISRPADSMLRMFVKKHQLADYITASRGGQHAVRELADLLIGLSGAADETFTNRFEFSKVYEKYLGLRNKPEATFYSSVDSIVTELSPII